MFDRKQKDAEVRAAIHKRLVQSGEQEQLLEYVRAQLVECGWRDEVCCCFVCTVN